jgi:tight adherence protein C
MSILGIRLGLDDLLAISSGATMLMVLLAVWHSLLLRDPVGERLRALTHRRNALRAVRLTPQAHGFRASLQQSGLGFMSHMVDRFHLMRGRKVEKIQAQLTRAGWRSRDALILYLFANTVAPLILGGGGFLFFRFSTIAPHNPSLRAIAIGLCLAAGFLGVRLWVKNAGDKRIKRMTKGLPDALDLLVVCAEAGLSLDMAITRVGREMAEGAPELSDEFAITAIELGFAPDRQTALHNLVKRTDMQSLRALVNSLAYCERYGTPIANALRVLSAEFRTERMMRAEEKAAKLPALMTVPMILFILPTLFMVIGGPAAIQVIDIMARR